MATEINKGIEPFEDQTDFTRGNKDRQTWGKGNSESLHLGSEYDVKVPPTESVSRETSAEKPPETPAPKFTHKLANGTLLEAPSIEELAAKIEASFKQTPPALDFEDKPLYKPYEFKHKDLSLAEQAEILNLWKENPQAAMRKLQEADLGAPVEVIIQKLQETQTVVRMKLEEEAGAEFMGECENYNPTVTNGKKLTAHLAKLGKPITKQNLVVAFNQLVAAGDKGMLRAPEPEAPPEPLDEVPPPPVIVPSNMGRQETTPAGQVDVAKFANMTLDQQKKYFLELKRGK